MFWSSLGFWMCFKMLSYSKLLELQAIELLQFSFNGNNCFQSSVVPLLSPVSEPFSSNLVLFSKQDCLYIHLWKVRWPLMCLIRSAIIKDWISSLIKPWSNKITNSTSFLDTDAKSQLSGWNLQVEFTIWVFSFYSLRSFIYSEWIVEFSFWTGLVSKLTSVDRLAKAAG